MPMPLVSDRLLCAMQAIASCDERDMPPDTPYQWTRGLRPLAARLMSCHAAQKP